MPKTSIIILTYNSEKYIEKLIETINEANAGQDYEIIVADNDSTDGTIKKVTAMKPKSRPILVRNGENIGFSAGINKGVRLAKGEYLLFINPDASWKDGRIEDLILVFDNNIGAGIVGGKLVNSNGKVEKSSGKFFSLIPSIYVALGLDEKLCIRFSPRKETKVDFVSGGFMMIRRELFERLHGFDENLFMYTEDMELCFRAKLANYSTFFTPSAVIEHASHGSSNRSFAIKNIYEGIFYFHKKHGTSFSYFIVKTVFRMKALSLVIIGKIINNKYLSETYKEALSVS